jgi:hypothetical protein
MNVLVSALSRAAARNTPHDPADAPEIQASVVVHDLLSRAAATPAPHGDHVWLSEDEEFWLASRTAAARAQRQKEEIDLRIYRLFRKMDEAADVAFFLRSP